MFDTTEERWVRYVATHSPVSVNGAFELYAFAQAARIDRDTVIETALDTRGNVCDIIYRLLQKKRHKDLLTIKHLEEITQNELWIDDELIGLFTEYNICINRNHIDKDPAYTTVRRKIPTTVDRYIDIKFADNEVYKYLYSDRYYPPILLKCVDTMQLKSPGKTIAATDVKIANRTPSRYEVRCCCEDITLCCV